MSRSTLSILTQLIIITSAILLALGLALPCMEIQPNFGAYDSWVRLFKPSLNSPTQFSILGGILKLISEGETAIGLLLLFFSCIFPTLKLTILSWAVALLARGKHAGPLLKIAHHTGKYSMLDVLVLSLLVLAIKGLPGNTAIHLAPGFYLFAASVILGIFTSILIHRLEKK
jgi:paraquat-inducible protein A